MKTILGKHWKYVNEGNAHIVIQLEGTENVLRLYKGEKPSGLDIMNHSVNYINSVMIPLFRIPNCSQEIVELSEEALQELNKDLLPLRPETRRHKLISFHFAIQTQNLTILSPKCEDNYCVEIKPKEGFIPASLASTSKCFYCLKQFMKMELKEIKNISHYCPLDLFSGDRQRMNHAIMYLINNPQNNFKFFKNSQVVYCEKSETREFEDVLKNTKMFQSLHEFVDFLINVLLNDFSQPQRTEIEVMKQNECENKCNKQSTLKPDSFLHNLLELQKLSEYIKVDSNITQNSGTEYVIPLLQFIECNKLDLSIESDRNTFLKTANPLHLALISSVAKDCSIMISFSSNCVEDYPSIEFGGKRISYKLAITDLEPKMAKTLVKRKGTENNVLDIYNKRKDMDV